MGYICMINQVSHLLIYPARIHDVLALQPALERPDAPASEPRAAWTAWLNVWTAMILSVKSLDTLWWTNIAMENGPFIVDFPIKNGDFPLLC